MKNKRKKSAQDIQDDIFRKMSFKTKFKLSCDFMAYGLKYNLAEGTKIPMSYLKSWMKKNKLNFKYDRFTISSEMG